MRVALLARNARRLDALAASVGPDAHPIACDLTEPDAVSAAFEQVDRELGAAQYVVFNAGTFRPGAVLDIAGFGRVFSAPGPTSAVATTFDVFNAGPAVADLFTLNYNECCGAPAVLQLSVAPGPVPGAGLPGLVVLALAGALAWARKFA